MSVGLAGYARWRLIRAGIGHGTQDKDSGLNRVAGVISGVAYAGLCVTAVEILAGSGGGSSSPKKEAGGVLAWTGGTVIVAVAGVILIGVALYQGYKGVSRKFLESSDTARMSRKVKRGFVAIGAFGHLARMVVFALIGFGLLKTAIDYNPTTRSASTELSTSWPTIPYPSRHSPRVVRRLLSGDASRAAGRGKDLAIIRLR
ncbi:MAG: DUF1206 domain-containing protein [Actinomycetota bacterium]|nr:DUF1206 domain-containing protein [Actinomycetota bacterium]